MEGFLILCLAGWVWWQSRRNAALSRRVDALESRVRALAAEREPLILDRPLPPEDEALVLSAPAPSVAAEAEPPLDPPSARAWAAVGLVAALYVWFGIALASGATALSAAIACAASLVGFAGVALPALAAPLRLGWMGAAAPGLTIGVSSVLLIWVWPLAAQTGLAVAPALAGALQVALGAYALRRRWAHGAPFAIAVAALVIGVAGYVRVRTALAPADISAYAAALSLSAVVAASAIAARPSHRERGLVAGAAAASSALLLTIGAFAHIPGGTIWSWAPVFLGTGAALVLAARSARDASAPVHDRAVLWWSGAACVLALVGAHILSPPALLPASLAAVALACAYIYVRFAWRTLSWAALAAGAIALLHALSASTQGAALGPLPAPWAAALAMAAAAALFQLAARTLRSNAPVTADALRAASWGVLVMAALSMFTQPHS